MASAVRLISASLQPSVRGVALYASLAGADRIRIIVTKSLAARRYSASATLHAAQILPSARPQVSFGAS